MKMESPVDRMLKAKVVFTNEKCEGCGQELTQKQFAYSVKVFNKKLCMHCQRAYKEKDD